MIVNKETNLVPCEILVSEAGMGLRTGEVRGLTLDVAEAMIAAKQARALTAAEISKGAKSTKPSDKSTDGTV